MHTLWQQTVRGCKMLLILAPASIPVLWSYDYYAAAMATTMGLVTLLLQWTLVQPPGLANEETL
jgi:hypothetical protein